MDHEPESPNQVPMSAAKKQTEQNWADQVEASTMEKNNNFLHIYPNLPDFLQDMYKKQEATDKKVSALTEALSNMSQIIKENAHLKIELENARAEIALLKNKQVVNDPTPSTKKALRPTIQILDNEDDGLEQSKHAPPPAQIQQLKNNYAAVVACSATKKTIQKKRPQPSKRAKEIAARHLTPVSESQGFQFIYVPCRHRMTIKAMRQILRTLHVDNSRILDIHFPDRQVAALLVHNDYAQPLMEILKKEGIQVKKDFDPLDPSILRDQKLADLSDEQRFEKVQEVHHNNLIKALQFIREPVKFAVARDFYKNSWITADELTSFLPTYKSQEERVVDAKAKAKSLLSDELGSMIRSRSASPSMEIDDESTNITAGNIEDQNTTSTTSTQIN